MGEPKSLRVRAIATVVIMMVLMALFAWGARQFEIDASADTLLTKDNKLYLKSQKIAERYDPDEFILIAYKPESGSIFSNETFDVLRQISAEVQEIDRVEAVNSILNVPIFTELDGLNGEINPEELTVEALGLNGQELSRKLSNHPLYENLLFNQKQTAVGMQVVFKPNEKIEVLDSEITAIKSHLLERELSQKEQKRLEELESKRAEINKTLEATRTEEIEKIREIISDYSSGGEFFLGGNNLLVYQLINIIKSDLVLFGLVIVALVSAVLFYLFRRWRWVLIPLACCACSVITTMGILGLIGLKVTVISANVIALQIILTLVVIVHLIVQYQELCNSDSEKSQQGLVLEAVKRKLKPCFYAGLTTSVGFGTLIFSGVQPVISFGWMMVIAMAVVLVVSLILFPAILLAFFSLDRSVTEHGFIHRIMHGCAHSVRTRPGLIISISVLLTLAGLAACFRLTAENSFLNYFAESTDVHRELSFIDREFGGSTPLDVIYQIPSEQQDPNLVVTAEAVQTLTDIHQLLDGYEAVGSITSVADFTRVAKTVMDKPLTEYELSVVYKTLDPALRTDLFSSYFNEENNELRISMRIQDTTEGLDREAFLEQVKADLAKAGVPEENVEITNLFVLYQDILSRLVDSQVTTLIIVYLAMAAVLLLVFRSIKVALICLVPNMITTALIMGVMGAFGIALDLMTITIASVAMGISVDDTIHYTHRYLQELKDGSDNAIKSTHLSVGYALLYTTIIIVIGFSSLMFSDFVPSYLFGLLTSLAMIFALVTDITVLPALLQRYIKPSEKSVSA